MTLRYKLASRHAGISQDICKNVVLLLFNTVVINSSLFIIVFDIVPLNVSIKLVQKRCFTIFLRKVLVCTVMVSNIFSLKISFYHDII